MRAHPIACRRRGPAALLNRKGFLVDGRRRDGAGSARAAGPPARSDLPRSARAMAAGRCGRRRRRSAHLDSASRRATSRGRRRRPTTAPSMSFSSSRRFHPSTRLHRSAPPANLCYYSSCVPQVAQKASAIVPNHINILSLSSLPATRPPVFREKRWRTSPDGR